MTVRHFQPKTGRQHSFVKANRQYREIRRRPPLVGTFPDGQSFLLLIRPRLRHMAGTQWGNKKYMNMAITGSYF